MLPSSPAPRFRFVRRLGAGGMGEVWLVDDSLRGHRAALKRIRTGRSWESRPLRALKREFRSVSALRHPHIVVPYELGTEADGLYLLMEHVPGEDVFRYCQGSDGHATSVEWSERYAETHPQSSLTSVSRAQRRELLESLASSLATRATMQLRSTLDYAHEVASPRNGEAATHPPLTQTGYGRLYRVLPQLLSALEHVHARGFVHRDIKPTNALVTEDGQLKLLDFGILSEHGSIPPAAIGGTVAYLAPEHIRGGLPARENDLYALGVLLYEIVTGRLPFAAATHRDILVQHVYAPHAPVQGLAPGCPGVLSAVIDGLLHKDPAARLTIADVRRELGGVGAFAEQTRVPTLNPAADSPRLFEREAEQARLRELLDGLGEPAFRFVVIGGASGVGKSALLAWLRAASRARGLSTFDARTRFDERVPFNALDELIDTLAAQLEAAPGLLADAEVQQCLRLAGQSFPVLEELCCEEVAPGPAHVIDVYDAVAALFACVASPRRPLVLCCDDLQWADADSVALLARLLSARIPHVALIAAVRPDTHSEPFAAFWEHAEPDVYMPLSMLSREATLALTSALSGRDMAELPDLVSITEGNPLFATLHAHLLAADAGADATRHPLVHLLGLLAPQMQTLRRRLLALVAVSDGEAPLWQLCELAECSAGLADQELDPLVFAHLLRAEGPVGPGRHYECQHDLVRRGLLQHLTPEETAWAHARLADCLERARVPASRRVRHLMGAGQHERAARLSVLGAEQAQAAHAYGLAADLYGIALRYAERSEPTSERALSLRAGLAQALESAGRYRAASIEWELVEQHASGQLRELAVQHAAMTLLATSDLKRGYLALQRARRQAPEPAWRALVGNVWAVARMLAGPLPRGLRGRHVVPSPRPRLGDTPDRENFLATMVGLFDPPAGVRAMLRARAEHVAERRWAQAAEIDYVLAYLAYYATHRHRRTALADRYLERARWLIGGPPTPEQGQLHAHEQMVLGVAGHHVGDWAAAETHLAEAIRGHEACGMRGTFAHQFSWLQRLQASRHRQHVATFARTLEAFRRLAGEVEDSNLSCHLGFHETAYALMRGEIALAHGHARRALDAWPDDPPSFQRFLCRFYACMPHIYEGDPSQALRDLRAAVREHVRFMPLRTMFAGDVLGVLAMLQARALAAGDAAASRADIERLARASAITAPVGRHLALRAAAYACHAEGDTARARRWLTRAEQLADDVGQTIDVAVARHHRGLLTPGAEGDTLVRSARTLLADAGAHPVLLRENPWLRG